MGICGTPGQVGCPSGHEVSPWMVLACVLGGALVLAAILALLARKDREAKRGN